MSARKYAQRLHLECSTVMRLRLLFVSAVLLSLLCTAVLPLSLLLKFLVLLLITLVALHCWRRRCELGAGTVTLTWDADSRWWWSQGGEETELALCGDSYLSTGMVILNFLNPASGRRRSLVLFPASVGCAVFRRLTVRLMLDGGQSAKGRQTPLDLFRASFWERGKQGP